MRSPLATLVSMTALWVNIISAGVVPLVAPRAECEGHYWLASFSNWALLLLFSTGFWRACQLVVKTEAQRTRLAIKLRDEGFEWQLDRNFFQRHMSFFSSRRLAVYVSLPVCLACLPCFSLVFLVASPPSLPLSSNDMAALL